MASHKRQRKRAARKRARGLRACISAVLLVAMLLGISYGWVAVEPLLGKEFSLGELFAQMLIQAGDAFSGLLDRAFSVAAWTEDRSTTQAYQESWAVPSSAYAGTPLLVNASNPLPEGYSPRDLVLLADYCPQELILIKSPEIQGQRHAVDALLTMVSAAHQAGLDSWQVSAGYRSLEDQQATFDEQVSLYQAENSLSLEQAIAATQRYVAQPGASEHHTGLAFDITVPGEAFRLTPQCQWLAEHCWEYGFIIRYTEDKESITGIAAEPWHIRYVGQPHALLLRENNWCLEEYLQTLHP